MSARVAHYTTECTASIIVSYQIVDVETALVKGSSRVNEKAEFKAEWGKFSGDEAALNSYYSKLCQVEEQFPPTREEMIFDIAEKLSTELAEKFKAYAR